MSCIYCDSSSNVEDTSTSPLFRNLSGLGTVMFSTPFDGRKMRFREKWIISPPAEITQNGGITHTQSKIEFIEPDVDFMVTGGFLKNGTPCILLLVGGELRTLAAPSQIIETAMTYEELKTRVADWMLSVAETA